MDPDMLLALKLHNEWNNNSFEISESPPKKKKKENNTNQGIVDPDWEITDPNPDIHSLFIVFDKKYFWGKLDCVEVKWSPRMYSKGLSCGRLGALLVFCEKIESERIRKATSVREVDKDDMPLIPWTSKGQG